MLSPRQRLPFPPIPLPPPVVHVPNGKGRSEEEAAREKRDREEILRKDERGQKGDRKEKRAQTVNVDRGKRETDNGKDISLVVRSKNRVKTPNERVSARPLRYAHRSHRDSLLRASRKGLQVAKAASLRRVYSPTRILMIPRNITRKGLRRRRPQTTERSSTVSRTRKSSLSLITVKRHVTLHLKGMMHAQMGTSGWRSFSMITCDIPNYQLWLKT